MLFWPTRICMPVIRQGSVLQQGRLRWPATSWRSPRSNGSDLRCCARRSKRPNQGPDPASSDIEIAAGAAQAATYAGRGKPNGKWHGRKEGSIMPRRIHQHCLPHATSLEPFGKLIVTGMRGPNFFVHLASYPEDATHARNATAPPDPGAGSGRPQVMGAVGRCDYRGAAHPVRSLRRPSVSSPGAERGGTYRDLRSGRTAG